MMLICKERHLSNCAVIAKLCPLFTIRFTLRSRNVAEGGQFPPLVRLELCDRLRDGAVPGTQCGAKVRETVDRSANCQTVGLP